LKETAMPDRQAAFAAMTAFLENAFRLLASLCRVRSPVDRSSPAVAVPHPGRRGGRRIGPDGHAVRPLWLKIERGTRISKRRKAMGGAAPG
jgi:hypothetical protein